jgi:peptidoglycan/xylan/chitin deacetylase (PgdA/CDA1 family)
MGAMAAGAATLLRPEAAVRLLSRILPGDVLFYVDTEARAFALTFDDGPHPATTPALLDVLAAHGARATFFLIGGRIPGNEPILARIVAEGHELASHLMRDEASIRLPDPEFRRQLAEVNTLLAPYGKARRFRPGSGWYTPRMLTSAAAYGLRCVLGTVPVLQDRTGPNGERIVRFQTAQIEPGSIVVLHEGTTARSTVAAITDRMLTELGRRGLAAVTVSELVSKRR